MRQVHHRRERAHVVTEARPSMSDDIAYRQRRYLIMMGIRSVCFVVAVVVFLNHAGWLTAIPIVGAIIIPYFAVVFANGGREPNSTRDFHPYEPNLPVYRPAARRGPDPGAGPAADAGAGEPANPGDNGASRHNA